MRDHTLEELTEECDGTYDGDSMMIWQCSCEEEAVRGLYT